MEIKNIKVTATYEEDELSKFDALWKEYEIARQIADVTKETLCPLIEAAGEKKLEMIYEQLEPITKYVISLANTHKMCKDESVTVCAYADRQCTERHSVTVSAKLNDRIGEWDVKIYLDGDSKRHNEWFGENGIVTKWNQYGLYEKLKTECESRLQKAIDQIKKVTNSVRATFQNMQNN